jgi:hypothetical protein
MFAPPYAAFSSKHVGGKGTEGGNTRSLSEFSGMTPSACLGPLVGPNPFVNTCHVLSPAEKLRLWAWGLFLVPVRLVIVTAAFLLCATCSWVATVGRSPSEPPRIACTKTVSILARM